MPTTAAPIARPRSGNRRDEDARRAVLHAADDLLVERGFAKMTVEELAKRAGVAKQTVYRWWPSKVEVLLDCLIEGAHKYLALEPAGATHETLEEYVGRFRMFVEERDEGKVYLALLGYAQHDDAASALLRERLLDPQRALEREAVLTAGMAETVQGADDILDAHLGAVLFRAMSRSPGE